MRVHQGRKPNIDWIRHTSESLQLKPLTAHMAMAYFDHLLLTSAALEQRRLDLYALVCLLIAGASELLSCRHGHNVSLASAAVSMRR